MSILAEMKITQDNENLYYILGKKIEEEVGLVISETENTWLQVRVKDNRHPDMPSWTTFVCGLDVVPSKGLFYISYIDLGNGKGVGKTFVNAETLIHIFDNIHHETAGKEWVICFDPPFDIPYEDDAE